jgi:hypothetical protein
VIGEKVFLYTFLDTAREAECSAYIYDCFVTVTVTGTGIGLGNRSEVEAFGFASIC